MEALTFQLKNEIDSYVEKYNKYIDTVFIGGGTPSTVSYNEYSNIFRLIQPYINNKTEITTEANPNSATREWLEGMYKLGVNRVSFGVQSFNDDKLKLLGRSHTSKRAIKAIQEASCIGFNSINCDIIYGVDGDSFQSLKEDFDIISTLPIDHLSAYSLVIEEGTKFFNKSSIKIDDEELSVEIFDYIKKIGFKQYEISNFTKNTKYESKHNKGYWEHNEYLGVGAGAVGHKNKTRFYPEKNIEKYILKPLSYEIENLNDEDIKMEKVLLGLRSCVGVNLNIFNTNESHRINVLIKENKLKLENNKVFNTNYLLADELALYILD